MNPLPDTSSPDLSYPCPRCTPYTCRCSEVPAQAVRVLDEPAVWPSWMAAMAANA